MLEEGISDHRHERMTVKALPEAPSAERHRLGPPPVISSSRNLSSPYSRAIFRRLNQLYKAGRNRISGYRTATIGMSRTSRRPTSDAIQNGRLCCRNGPAEGRKCANFFSVEREGSPVRRPAVKQARRR